MRRSDFRGLRSVFSFTLTQYLKSKSTIASIVLMVVMSLGGLLIASYTTSGGDPALITEIRIDDRTGVGVTAEMIAVSYPGVKASGDADVTLTFDEADDRYTITAEGEAAPEQLQALERAALQAFNAVRTGKAAVYTGRAVTMEEYLSPPEDGEEDGFSGTFTVSYLYGIVVMFLSILSSSYIIRSVIEEKASRLAETMMVSVSPLALILGKILACMCLVLIMLATMAAGVVGAALISRFLLGRGDILNMLASTGALEAIANMNAFALFGAIVSILLGYATFAMVGALAAARCDRMEDSGSASMSVMLIVMAGYIAGVATVEVQGTAAAVISLIPILSVFVAPAKYALGAISAGTLALSWVLQLAVIALLAVFSRKVYSALLIHSGGRVKLRALMGLAGIGGGRHD